MSESKGCSKVIHVLLMFGNAEIQGFHGR